MKKCRNLNGWWSSIFWTVLKNLNSFCSSLYFPNASAAAPLVPEWHCLGKGHHRLLPGLPTGSVLAFIIPMQASPLPCPVSLFSGSLSEGSFSSRCRPLGQAMLTPACPTGRVCPWLSACTSALHPWAFLLFSPLHRPQSWPLTPCQCSGNAGTSNLPAAR